MSKTFPLLKTFLKFFDRYTQIWFGLRCMFPTWSDWNITYTAKGLAKKRVKSLLRYTIILCLAAGFPLLKRKGLTEMKLLLKQYPKLALMAVAAGLQNAASKI